MFAKNARLQNKLPEMLGELAGLCWDVVLLCETRSALGTVPLDSGHLFIGSTPLSPAAGVGILLRERHVSKIKLVKQISLRLMFADVAFSHGTVRFVAAYAPHSGYSRDVLNQFYEDLHACLEDARGGRFQLVVGGDFNTQLNTGFRGTLLQDVVETFDFTITNDDDNHTSNMDTWTFESACGVRRRIDFIMCSQEMRFTSAHATCNLDLGSDHRAVTVSFDLGVRRRKNRKCFHCIKRWKPPLDQQGVPRTYHAILQDELGVKKPTTLHGLEGCAATVGSSDQQYIEIAKAKASVAG